MKFGFIAKHRAIWPASWLCEALGVSRSGFHAWLTRAPSARSRSDEEIGAKVRASFMGSDRTYGARRVWHDVLADGISCGLHRIERLMRQQALRARPRRRNRRRRPTPLWRWATGTANHPARWPHLCLPRPQSAAPLRQTLQSRFRGYDRARCRAHRAPGGTGGGAWSRRGHRVWTIRKLQSTCSFGQRCPKIFKKYPIEFADFLFEISQVGVSSEYSPKRWDSAILPEPMFHQPRINPCPTRPRPPKATVPQGV